MGYLCLSCFEEYDGDLLKLEYSDGYRHRCPNKKCGDINLVEIDDLILPVIKLLNIKGYYTEYTCSAHSYENNTNTYIAFDEECVPDVIPKGFFIEDDKYYEENYHCSRTGNNMCIRKWYDEELNKYELHKEICKTMINLMKWVEKLPYRDEYEENIEQCDLRQEHEI